MEAGGARDLPGPSGADDDLGASLHEVATNVVSLATDFHDQLLGTGVDEADRAFRMFHEALVDAGS